MENEDVYLRTDIENPYAYDEIKKLIHLFYKGNNVPVIRDEAELIEWVMKQYNDAVHHLNWQLQKDKEPSEVMFVWLLFVEEIIKFYMGAYFAISYQQKLINTIECLIIRVKNICPQYSSEFKLEGYN